ncbi:MAG: hypothetical protein R3C97_18440 [Geminicoccaceae bacterium]
MTPRKTWALAPVFALFVLTPGLSRAQAPQSEENDWNIALADGSEAAFRQFLSRYPAGRFASDAFRCAVEVRIDPAAGGCSLEQGGGPPTALHVQIGHFVANIP